MRAALLLIVMTGLPWADATAMPTTRSRTVHPTRPARPLRSAATPRDRYPAIPIYAVNVNQALVYRPYDGRGRARRDAARSLEYLLRCRQTGARHHLHPRLGDALYQIGRHYAGHRIDIYSGYRPRAYCTRAHSRHMTGSAIDFHIDGVRNEDLIAYLRKTFHPAGVGFYPHGVHVHLDVERGHDTYWVDPGPASPAERTPDPAIDPTIAEPRDTAPLPPEAEVAETVDLPVQALPLPPPPDDDPTIPATGERLPPPSGEE
jgi:uncharacterized protein YcbK (DUF882 family)